MTVPRGSGCSRPRLRTDAEVVAGDTSSEASRPDRAARSRASGRVASSDSAPDVDAVARHRLEPQLPPEAVARLEHGELGVGQRVEHLEGHGETGDATPDDHDVRPGRHEVRGHGLSVSRARRSPGTGLGGHFVTDSRRADGNSAAPAGATATTEPSTKESP